MDADLQVVDPQIARLPHPQRFIAAMTRTVVGTKIDPSTQSWFEIVLGKVAYEQVKATLASMPLDWAAIEYLATKLPAFAQLSDSMASDPTGTYGGQMYWACDHARWMETGRHFLQTTDALDAALQDTDIGDEIPIAHVRAPFAVQYIQFGESMTSPLRVYNGVSGLHTAEGCYVLSGTIPEGFSAVPNGPIATGQRFLQMVFTGSPIGHKHVLDDATQAITCVIPDEDATAASVIENALAMDLSLGRARVDLDAENVRTCFLHVCKILVFMNTEAVVRTEHKERSELLAQLARMKGGGKAAKLERKLPRALDRIVISPRVTAAPPVTVGGLPTGRHQPTHYRRGHFRNQVYGAGRALRRPIWIAPVLINSDAAVSVAGKPYLLKD